MKILLRLTILGCPVALLILTFWLSWRPGYKSEPREVLTQLKSATSTAQASPGLTTENGVLVLNGHRYRGVGANYFDLFLRILASPTNATGLSGLERLSRAGIPFVRFAMMYDDKDMKFYFQRREEYFRRLDLVVRTAEGCKMGLIPSMNWTFDLSEIAHEPRDQWGNAQSQTSKLMRQFVGGVVNRYKDSPAIWGWEFGNEPNLVVDLPNAAQLRKPGGTARDDLSSAHISTAISEFALEVRRHDTTRPIFSGNSHPRASAWHNTHEKSWKADSRQQFQEVLRRDNPSPLDTITVHLYANEEVQKDMGAWASDRMDWLGTLKEVAGQMRRPLFVGEFGLPIGGGEEATQATFKRLLMDMEQAGVDLAAFWVFDFGPQEDSWSVEFENSRASMIQLTAEANQSWNKAAWNSAKP